MTESTQPLHPAIPVAKTTPTMAEILDYTTVYDQRGPESRSLYRVADSRDTEPSYGIGSDSASHRRILDNLVISRSDDNDILLVENTAATLGERFGRRYFLANTLTDEEKLSLDVNLASMSKRLTGARVRARIALVAILSIISIAVIALCIETIVAAMEGGADGNGGLSAAVTSLTSGSLLPTIFVFMLLLSIVRSRMIFTKSSVADIHAVMLLLEKPEVARLSEPLVLTRTNELQALGGN